MVLEEWELSGTLKWAVMLKAIKSISFFTSEKQRVHFHYLDDGTRRLSLEPGAASELNDPPQSSFDECISEIILRFTACDATQKICRIKQNTKLIAKEGKTGNIPRLLGASEALLLSPTGWTQGEYYAVGCKAYGTEMPIYSQILSKIFTQKELLNITLM